MRELALPAPQLGGGRANLVLAGFSAFFTALAGRIRELYAEAELRTASEPVPVAE